MPLPLEDPPPAPSPDAVLAVEDAVRRAFLGANVVLLTLPECEAKSHALAALQQARDHAMAAVAPPTAAIIQRPQVRMPLSAPEIASLMGGRLGRTVTPPWAGRDQVETHIEGRS